MPIRTNTFYPANVIDRRMLMSTVFSHVYETNWGSGGPYSKLYMIAN